MAKFYSAATGGFYSSAIHGSDMPADVVSITDDAWQKLCDGQATGKVITSTATGKPRLSDPPALTEQELIVQAEDKKNVLRADADYMIQPLQDAADLDIATESEKALLSQWKNYRVQLNRVDTSEPSNIIWPQKPA